MRAETTNSGSGRGDRLAETRSALTRARPWLTVLAGEPGSGLSTALDQLARDLAADAAVVRIRLVRTDFPVAYSGMSRLLYRIRLPGSEGERDRRSLLVLLARLSSAPKAPAPQADANIAKRILRLLSALAPLRILIDDAQWLDPGTAKLIEFLARRCSHDSRVSAVLTVRVPGSLTSLWPVTDTRRGVLQRLTAEGAARVRLLRPFSLGETREFLGRLIPAVLDADLVRLLHRQAHGNPRILGALAEASRTGGHLRVVDGHAFLVRPEENPFDGRAHLFSAVVRDLVGDDSELFKVAGALAVLAPLGQAAVPVAASWLGYDDDAVRRSLARLRDGRVLSTRAGRVRFRAPAIRDGLAAALGPYARRRLAELAVAAVRSGQATGVPEDFVLDCLAAGAPHGAEATSDELYRQGIRVLFADGARAQRWLSGAARITTREDRKAVILSALTAGLLARQRIPEAAQHARTLLAQHGSQLDASLRQEAAIVYIIGLAATRDQSGLAAVAAGESEVLAGGHGTTALDRSVALMLLGRWKQGRDLLLASEDPLSTKESAVLDLRTTIGAYAGVVVGDCAPLHLLLEHPPRWRNTEPRWQQKHRQLETDLLLALGELNHVHDRLDSGEFTADEPLGPDRFLVHHLGGSWTEALAVSRRVQAENHYAGPLSTTFMVSGCVQILGARGRIKRARELVAEFHDDQLAHVLALAEAALLDMMSEHESADQLLLAAAKSVDGGGYVLGTEGLWPALVVSALRRGQWAEARSWANRSANTAGKLGTARAHLAHDVSQALVWRDRTKARRALASARLRRDVPFEYAAACLAIGSTGYETERLWGEAYEIFGELEAWLWRAQLRRFMQKRHIGRVSRAETTTENDRLLAVLIADGLTNRQLAAVLEASEKSIEGRLNRMFARTGYRSRVEVATAITCETWLS
jgi:DNA-binding CsgD family transcriptional regulator